MVPRKCCINNGLWLIKNGLKYGTAFVVVVLYAELHVWGYPDATWCCDVRSEERNS